MKSTNEYLTNIQTRFLPNRTKLAFSTIKPSSKMNPKRISAFFYQILSITPIISLPIPQPLIFFLFFVFAPFLRRAVKKKREDGSFWCCHDPKHRTNVEAHETRQHLSSWRKYHQNISSHAPHSLEHTHIRTHTHYFCAPFYILVR